MRARRKGGKEEEGLGGLMLDVGLLCAPRARHAPLLQVVAEVVPFVAGHTLASDPRPSPLPSPPGPLPLPCPSLPVASPPCLPPARAHPWLSLFGSFNEDGEAIWGQLDEEALT